LLTTHGIKDSDFLDEHWDHSLVTLDDELSSIAAAHGAAYISLLRLLCSGYSCSNTDAAGLPLVFDEEHLTAEGSNLVAMKLRAQGVWTFEPSLSHTL
jgi:hypothetical protein